VPEVLPIEAVGVRRSRSPRGASRPLFSGGPANARERTGHDARRVAGPDDRIRLAVAARSETKSDAHAWHRCDIGVFAAIGDGRQHGVQDRWVGGTDIAANRAHGVPSLRSGREALSGHAAAACGAITRTEAMDERAGPVFRWVAPIFRSSGSYERGGEWLDRVENEHQKLAVLMVGQRLQ
jgi:hypothetical protein